MPFDDFADLWTPTAFASQLPRSGHPLALRVAGVDLALFRDDRGVARALRDHCPHRGVKLSLGQIRSDGCVECPFHAWRFAGDGACMHVPLSGGLSAEKRRSLGAQALPVVEKGGMVFVFTGDAAHPEAVAGPWVSPSLLRDDVSRYEIQKVWNTHWTRAMENMLDWPHVPFVHTATIGFGQKKRIAADARMHIELTTTHFGFHSKARIEGLMDDYGEGSLDWNRPNGMTLNIPLKGKLWQQHVWCVPVDASHVRMMVVSVRGFGVNNPLMKLLDFSSRKILSEDRAIVESSWPSQVPPAADEKSVATDQPTLVFRRWYRGRLDGKAPHNALRVVTS